MRRKWSWSEILSVVLVGATLLGAGIVLLVMTAGGSAVHPAVTVEAGVDTLSPALFLSDATASASFQSDVSALSLSTPGTYDVALEVSGRAYTSRLIIVDTVAPSAVALPREIAPSQTLKAEELVTDIRDATEVTAAFVQEPAFGTEGRYEVTVRLTDTAGNTTDVPSSVTVTRVRSLTEVDMSHAAPEVSAFLLEPDSTARLLTDITPLLGKGPGDHIVQIQTAGRTYGVTLRVTDLTPPAATPQAVTIWEDATAADPAAFVKNVKDASAVTAAFVTEPVYGTVGKQQITVRLTDAHGNTADFTAELTVARDTTPPVITGTAAREVYVGETVSYKKGIVATDDKDGEVTVTVDSSKVNLNKEGTYTVYFTATDTAGNSRTAEQKIIVMPAPAVTQAQVNEQADKVLDRIIKETMTAGQKAEAVYNWVVKNLTYTDSIDDTDWLDAAYHGFTLRRGDCYQYYAVTKALLDRCGIENLMVKRTEKATTKHYWLLVNVGSGWYHMDTTPHHIRSPFRCFMKTDKEVWDYAAGRVDGRKDYYDFDTELYPPRATKPYAE